MGNGRPRDPRKQRQWWKSARKRGSPVCAPITTALPPVWRTANRAGPGVDAGASGEADDRGATHPPGHPAEAVPAGRRWCVVTLKNRLAKLERAAAEARAADDEHCPRCGKVNADVERTKLAERSRAFRALPEDEQRRQVEEHRRAMAAHMADQGPRDPVECGGRVYTWEKFRSLPLSEKVRVYFASERERYCQCGRR